MAEFQPTQMLAILLGASKYPRAPKLASGAPFNGSAEAMLEYLHDANGLGVPEVNVLDLFNDSRSPSDQLNDINEFLDRRRRALKENELNIEYLLLYYVGHGLFARGGDEYCLAVRSTSDENEGATSIRAADLAESVRGRANAKRHILIFDCCFSARLFREFQSGPLNLARERLMNEFPARGTSLFCSSNSRDASIAPQGETRTMFSGAVIDVLRHGHPNFGPRFSLSELGDAVRETLHDKYAERLVRPEVLSPDQREGDVALIPLFPNPAYKAEQRSKAVQRIEQRRRERTAEEQRRAREMEERAAQEKAEAEAKRKKEEEERLAREKADAERIAAEQAEKERQKAARQAAKERTEREKAAEAKRVKEEQERLAREKAEAERVAAEQAEKERQKAARQAAKEQAAREKAEAAAKEERAAAKRIATAKADAKRREEQEDFAKRLASEEARAEAQRRPASEKQAMPVPGVLFESNSASQGDKSSRYLLITGLVVFFGIILGIWIANSKSPQQTDGSGSSNFSDASANGGAHLDNFKLNSPPANEWNGDSAIESVALQVVYTLKQQAPLERARGLAFSPDGTLLATAWQEIDHTPSSTLDFKGNGVVRLWNVATGELVKSLKPPGDDRRADQYNSVAFSPDGKWLATSSDVIGASTLHLWDVQSGTLLKTFPASEGMRRLAFSPDGHFLAGACDDGFVYVWNPETGEGIASLKHPYMVVSVAFSPTNAAVLAAGDYKQSVRAWNLTTKTRLAVLYSQPPSYGEAVAFSPDGGTLATGHASGTLVLWDASNWTRSRVVRPAGQSGITSVSFSPDGKLLAATDEQSDLSFWDVQGKALGRWNISDGSATTGEVGPMFAFSPRQHLVATTVSGDFVQIMKVTLKHAGEQ